MRHIWTHFTGLPLMNPEQITRWGKVGENAHIKAQSSTGGVTVNRCCASYSRIGDWRYCLGACNPGSRANVPTICSLWKVGVVHIDVVAFSVDSHIRQHGFVKIIDTACRLSSLIRRS